MRKRIISLVHTILYFLRLKKRKQPSPGSTIITVAGPAADDVKEEITETVMSDERSVQRFLCEYVIPDDKADALAKYVADLRKKNPTMKNDRIFRKSAEYFRFKKIGSVQNQMC